MKWVIAVGLAMLLPMTAIAEVVYANPNYKPIIVLENPGPNVLTGCGEQGRVATLRLRIPPKQDSGNAWNGEHYLHIQATGAHELFEFRERTGAVTRWRSFVGNGTAAVEGNVTGEHTIEVRVRTGQNIGYNGGGKMSLTLRKNPQQRQSPQFDKYKVYNPAIQLHAVGGRGCQTRAQNPDCSGFWDWTGGVPTCLLGE